MQQRPSASSAPAAAARAPVQQTKFVLKPYKPTASVDQARAVEIWSKLQHAFGKIYKGEASSLSYEELYR